MKDADIDWDALRQPEHAYPPWVQSAEERRRWDLAAAIADQIFGDLEDSTCVWYATRAIYNSDSQT